jgi:hypothetical protein
VTFSRAINLILAAFLLSFVQPSKVSAEAIGTPPPVIVEVDDVEMRTMSLIVSGTPDAATQIFANTPLMAGRFAEISALNSQIASAASIYGSVVSWERIGDRRIGSFVVNRRYAVQHQQMITLWYVTYIKVDGAWRIGGLYFNDQVMQVENDW